MPFTSLVTRFLQIHSLEVCHSGEEAPYLSSYQQSYPELHLRNKYLYLLGKYIYIYILYYPTNVNAYMIHVAIVSYRIHTTKPHAIDIDTWCMKLTFPDTLQQVTNG